MGRQIAAITRIDSIVTLPRRNDRFCLTSLSIVKFRFTMTHHAEFLLHHFPTLLRRLRSARMVETVTIAEDCCTRLNALHYSLNFCILKVSAASTADWGFPEMRSGGSSMLDSLSLSRPTKWGLMQIYGSRLLGNGQLVGPVLFDM